MRTRDEAIEYLLARGFDARKRDWSLGQTILIAHELREAGGIRGHEKAVYVYGEGGRCGIYDVVNGVGPSPAVYESLGDAVGAAIRTLRPEPPLCSTRSRAKPCGTPGRRRTAANARRRAGV